jgi:transcriptional regulator GlxA family with amidase domain
VRFAPGTGPTVFGVPASELRDQRVPLDALWPESMVRDLTEQMAEAPNRGVALESLAVDRVHQAGPPDPLLAEVVAELQAGRPVASLAPRVGLSERQLHRRCLAAFGYGPKALARILRLRRAQSLALDEVPFAQVAAIAGYADQPHLAREIKALTGVSLSRLTGS